MLRRQFDGELSAVAWLEGSPQLLLQLLHGCDEPDVRRARWPPSVPPRARGPAHETLRPLRATRR